VRSGCLASASIGRFTSRNASIDQAGLRCRPYFLDVAPRRLQEELISRANWPGECFYAALRVSTISFACRRPRLLSA
jgi:hypothetical protein